MAKNEKTQDKSTAATSPQGATSASDTDSKVSADSETPQTSTKDESEKNDDLEIENDIEKSVTSQDKSSNADINGSDDAIAISDELAVERDKYLRLAAEYDNYRKRSTKEREMTYGDARVDSISKLLPIYDNLERALQTECSDEAFYKGIEMIMSQLNDMFENMNVKHIPAVGEQFNPNLHNAVMSIVDPNLGENIIAEEYQKGFTLGDRIIRFSTVVVANSK